MSRRLRISGVLLILGLVVEGFSLHWNTAFSFLAFMMLGGGLFAAGVIVYLLALLHHERTAAPRVD
jgi:hypothetical protein